MRMPFDQKRINGPETSFSYKQFVEKAEDSKKPTNKVKRADGRKMSEHRQFAVQLKAISTAKGSCYIENGNTKVICAVSSEVPKVNKYAEKGFLHCDFKYAAFSREQRKSIGENEEKLIATNIRTALESTVCLTEFPNYQIDVFIMVLEDDGAVLSTAINAAGMAFIDAAIPCYDIVTSSSIAIINGQLLIDPSRQEEEQENNKSQNHGIVTISSLNSLDQIAQILFSGFVDDEILIKSAKKQILELNKQHANHMKKIISLKIGEAEREC